MLPRVLIVSSGNPDGALLVAGLLCGRPRDIGAVLVQGVESPLSMPDIVCVLEEVGLDLHSWMSRIVSGPPVEPVEIGLTICIPVCDT